MTRDRARKKAIRARMAASGEPYSVAARNRGTSQPSPGASEPPSPSDPSAVRDVVARAEVTLAAPSARIEFRIDWTVVLAEQARLRRPGPMGRLIRLAAKAAWRRIAPDTDLATLGEQFAHQVSEGFLEPAAGRYQLDSGAYAQMCLDGQHFGGRPGVLLEPRHRGGRTVDPHDPLGLLTMLRHTTEARPAGHETLRGTPCRKLTVRTGPAELTVWLDTDHIRQLQFQERSSDQHSTISRTRTLELWDFGVPVASLDWTRLPAFRSPPSS